MAAASNHISGNRRQRRPKKRLLLVLGIVIGMLLLTGAITLGPYIFARNDYAATASIEQRADFRSPALMKEAWALPVAKSYRSGRFEYQANPSFCAPASIANLLRSTGRQSSQQQVIDGTTYEPWFGILIGGMTLDEAADLLTTRAGASARIVRDPSLSEFRRLLAASNDPAQRMIVNFHRGPLFGRGHGHFSPILGYLEDRDLVFVGDVNAEYRPFLVSSERLWRAVQTTDSETGQKRGLIIAAVAQQRHAGP